MQSKCARTLLGQIAVVLLFGLLLAPARSAVIFDQTLVNPNAVANPNVQDLNNCFASEGCLGFGSTLAIPSVFAPLAFFLTPAQVAAIAGTPVVASFTVVASRDIGHKAGAPEADYLVTTGDGGVFLGDMFRTTIDTCPAGERGTDFAADLVCGPNFHTDVTAADVVTMADALVKSFAADGVLTFTQDPTATVGRLKFFSFRLLIEEAAKPVPEPSTAGLLALGLLLAPWIARVRQKRRS